MGTRYDSLKLFRDGKLAIDLEEIVAVESYMTPSGPKARIYFTGSSIDTLEDFKMVRDAWLSFREENRKP